MQNSKRSLSLFRCLLIVAVGLIFLSNSDISRAADPIEEGQPAPYGGIIFDDEAAGKLLFDVQRLKILEERERNLVERIDVLMQTNENLKDQVSNLRQQLELSRQLIEIEKEKNKIYESRAEFYKELAREKDKIIEQHQKVEEKLMKEAEKKSFWKSIAIGELLLIIGIGVGLIL